MNTGKWFIGVLILISVCAARAKGSYEESFLSLYQQLEREYPCFEMKGIDWKAVGVELLPEAEKVKTDEEFGLLCIRLLAELKDSHAGLQAGSCGVPAIVYPKWDSGFVCLKDAQGNAAVYHVAENSSAKQKGVKPGMILVEINEVKTADAIKKAKGAMRQHWGYSTDHNLDYHAYRRFARQHSQGETLNLVMEDTKGRERKFKVRADTEAGYTPRLPVPIKDISDGGRNVQWKKLHHNIGYIYVRRIQPDLSESLDLAVKDLKNTDGIIIDVRGNSGGGFDFNTAHYNFNLESSDITNRLKYRKPLALLISPNCISAGEGWASWFIANKRSKVFGEPTAGASGRKTVYTLPNGLYKARYVVKPYKGYLDRYIEGRGLEPDVPALQTAADLADGRDTVLEAALDYLRMLSESGGKDAKPGQSTSAKKNTNLPLRKESPSSILDQKFEKAYYLETAKGQVKNAATIYQAIAESEPTAENKGAIKKSLLRLLHIGTYRNHEATIRACHEKLLTQTDTTIQELVDLTKEGSVIHIPPGTYEGTIIFDKSITLLGCDRNNTIITAEVDGPVVHVPKKLEVALKSLTIKSQLETSERSDPPGCAIMAKDSTVFIRDCEVIALGNTKRCPLGLYIQGFAEVQLLDSYIEGYDYPILYGQSSKGTVEGCIVRNPGSCGFISHAETEVTIEKNIFTGSNKHGVRSTGGTIFVRNNLIIKNRNRGVYLGNSSAHGELINNAIIENGSGISAFASSDVEIENNVILKNGFSGIDTRYYGQIQVKNNIIAENVKTGFAVFEEGNHEFKISKNTFYANGEPSTDYNLPSSTIADNPDFADPDNGNFSVGNSTVESAGHGLTNPETISNLWKKYMELAK